MSWKEFEPPKDPRKDVEPPRNRFKDGFIAGFLVALIIAGMYITTQLNECIILTGGAG